MRGTYKLVLLGVCLFGAAAGSATLAAFSSQSSNAGNTFGAAASFGDQLRMASGSYTGNGNDNRSIGGLGFQPDVLIVKGNIGDVAMLRTSTMSGDASKRLVGGNAVDANRIQAIEADGFQLGNHNSVNRNGDTYYWTAFKAATGVLKVGTYTGNGTVQSIAGVGFSPDYVITASSAGERAVQWFSGATNTYRFEADAGVATGVTATDADGFTVADDNNVNNAGRTYHYVAFNETPGSIKVGTYDGNGTGQSVAGVGFAPEYVIVRAQANVTGQHRNVVVPGSESLYFQGNANLTTAVTALEADGFGVGDHASVNTSATTYQYVAFENGAGGCSQPSQVQILIASGDSWVNEASPATGNGSATTLRVTSQTGGQNQRAFVDFDLPSLPTGCVVTDADLWMNNTAPASGRTLEVRRAGVTWAESSITWSNQPATTGPAATAVTTGTAGWMSWDVTALANALYTSGDYGVRVADQNEGSAAAATQVFGARENAGFIPPVLLLAIGS